MKKWEYTIGVDVSKNTLDLQCAEINEHIQINNGVEGFKQFLKWCKTHRIDLTEKSKIEISHFGYSLSPALLNSHKSPI